MPVINEEPSATTSTGANVANGKLKESSSSTASLNKLMTGAGGGSSQCAITMKQSLSMTSLPAPSLHSSGSAISTVLPPAPAQMSSTATTTTSHGDSGSEMIQARLRAERPYNSLKVSRIEELIVDCDVVYYVGIVS